MPGDEREDHTVEGAVGSSNRSRGLLDANERLRATFAISDMKRGAEKRSLRTLTEREPVAASFDPVLAPKHLGLRDELIAAHRARV